jgi:hypothetical protein
MLRPSVRKTLIEKAGQAVDAAKTKLAEAESAARAAHEKQNAALDAGAPSAEPRIFLHDDFSRPNPDVWNTVSGVWEYAEHQLVQTAVTSFATIVTKENHPSDFKVHLRYRPLEPGGYRSIGFSFDYQDQGNSQDVYTSTNDKRQSVQAFHRVGGRQVYPTAGIVYTELKVGEEATLEVDVRGSQLIIDLNGDRKLTYTMPVERRDGKFALWVHQGSAEFLELKITEHAESQETLQRRAAEADRAAELAMNEVELAGAEWQSVERRLAAEIAAHLEADAERARELAMQASRAERTVAVIKAELELDRLARNADANAENKALATAQERLDAARAALKTPSETYSPLGDQYPKTSTGRRKALAEWIASPANPRTARVAVNHLWGRHFGRPLVASPENFGLNGRQPTHPQLLDWLAAELIEHDWRMKPLHRQIVLSSAYRMSTRAVGAEHALAEDPENRLLWRMNSRRMEAEVVRDSTLYLADQLNLTIGGPEIAETAGESVLRRSLYFRNTPNAKMPLLEVFDMADPNSCYRRKESVVPHQSLAMMNSGLTLDHARIIAAQIASTDDDFVSSAFETVLSRRPTDRELERCQKFLLEQSAVVPDQPSASFAAGGSAKRSPASDQQQRARENLVHVLLLHNDFVTIR